MSKATRGSCSADRSVAPASGATDPDRSRTGIRRTGRRARILLGTPESLPARSHLQVFTWFTEGRDWVRVEIRHATDSGLVIQTAVADAEMTPKAALTLATQLASRWHIRFVYFEDAVPPQAVSNSGHAGSWQLRIR